MTNDKPNPDDSDRDEAIEPDEVTSGRGEMRGDIDDPFGLDDLAERAVDVVFALLDRVNSLARAVLVFAVVSCALAFVLGLAALGGGLRIAWVIVGGAFGAISIGSVLLSMWRLRLVRAGGDALVDEVRTLIGGDEQSERTVIETVESTSGVENDGIVQLSRQFFSLRETVTDHTSSFAALSLALSSITSFPGLMALATVIGIGMLGTSVIFLLVLIF